MAGTCEKCCWGSGEHAEGCATPIEAALLSRHRWQLARDFMELPHHEKVRAMKAIGIIAPKEQVDAFGYPHLPHTIWVECFKRVKGDGLMRELRAEINARMPKP